MDFNVARVRNVADNENRLRSQCSDLITFSQNLLSKKKSQSDTHTHTHSR